MTHHGSAVPFEETTCPDLNRRPAEIHNLRDLRNEVVRLSCPHCKTEVTKEGTWLISIRKFRCPTCSAQTELTYERKIEIFREHLQSAEAGCAIELAAPPRTDRRL